MLYNLIFLLRGVTYIIIHWNIINFATNRTYIDYIRVTEQKHKKNNCYNGGQYFDQK